MGNQVPLPRKNPPPFKPLPDQEVERDSFNGGWNNLFKPTELKPNELTQADNLMLIGAGTPTGRWGSALFSQAGETGRVRLLDAYYNSLTSTNFLLTITDSGYLTYQSGASYIIIPGASFASGANYFGVQMQNNYYINGPSTNFVKFNASLLIPYLGLSTPTNVSIGQLSAASGFNTYSWIVTTLSQAGETLSSVSKQLASLPLDLTQTSIRVSWNAVSAASGVLAGYNIYRGFPGDETLIGSTGPNATQFIDVGGDASNTVFPPVVDTTTGPKARYRLKFDDRIILAGLDGEPDKVLISARYPFHDQFNAVQGGGYILVSPLDGDQITGLGIAGNQGMSTGGSAPPASTILVFKQNAVHRVVLSTTTVGNFVILDPQAQLLTSSNGCSSADSISPVENDTFYFGQKGLYTVGQEQNYLNQIRTNELSARIRPYVRNLSDQDFKEATAGYLDKKYVLSFATRGESVVYDLERVAFMGVWKTPFGITKWLKYYDPAGAERWMAGIFSTGGKPQVQEFSTSYTTDSGTAIPKTLRTRKEDFTKWSIIKVLKLFYILVRNVRGSVTINLRLEDKNGTTTTSKSFNITSSLNSGGWGNDQWGSQQWGQTDATIVSTGDELVRYTQLYKQFRVAQVEVLTTGTQDNYELLKYRMTAQSLGDQSLPATDRV